MSVPRKLISLLAAVSCCLVLVLPGAAARPFALTASLSVPATAFTDEVVLIDARGSTDVSAMPQSNGMPSVLLEFGDGKSCFLLACGHHYKNAGVYTVTLTVKDALGNSASTTAGITVIDVPAATGGNVQHLTDSGNAATNATNLQNAITIAKNQNTVVQDILLDGSWPVTTAGPITLSVPVGNAYIRIRWTGLSILNNNRITTADLANAPTITAPSSGGTNTPALQTPTPAPASGSHHYILEGLHLGKDLLSAPASRLMDIGQDSGAGQTAVSQLPHHFIIKHCWFDGGASDTSQVTNGVRIYANYVTIKDSVLKEFRLIGLGVDAATISLASGQGPHSFVNNELVASSENFNASGGLLPNTATITSPTTTNCTLSDVTNLAIDQNIALPVAGNYSEKYSTIVRSVSGNNITYDAIPNTPNSGGLAVWGATPSYFELRDNYLYKNLCWRATDPCYNGQNTQVKNLFELKFSRYAVIDGNVFRWTWIKDQDYAIVIAVRGSTIGSGNTPASVVRQIQFSNNIVQDAAKGITLQAGDPAAPAQLETDLIFYNNLFRNVGNNWDSSGAGHQMINYNGANDDVGGFVQLKRVFVNHQTFDNGTPSNANMAISDFGSAATGSGVTSGVYLNTVSQDCGFGFFSSASGTNAALNITNFMPPGTSANWNKNLVVNTNGHPYPAAALTQTATWSSGVFVNYASGNFLLEPGSPGKNAATDGTDIGVIMATLTAATACAISGQCATPTPPPGTNGGSIISGKAAISGKVVIQQ